MTMQNNTANGSKVLPVDEDETSMDSGDADNTSVPTADNTMNDISADSTPIVMQNETSMDPDDADHASMDTATASTPDSTPIVIQDETSMDPDDADSASMDNATAPTPDNTPVVIQDETSMDPDDADDTSVPTTDNTMNNTTPDSTPVVNQNESSMHPDEAQHDSDAAPDNTMHNTTFDSTPVVSQDETSMDPDEAEHDSDSAPDNITYNTTLPPMLESNNQTTQMAIIDNAEIHAYTQHNASTITSGDTFVVVSTNNIFGRRKAADTAARYKARPHLVILTIEHFIEFTRSTRTRCQHQEMECACVDLRQLIY